VAKERLPFKPLQDAGTVFAVMLCRGKWLVGLFTADSPAPPF